MAMYSPPDTENNVQFVALSQVFLSHGVAVPRVHAYDSVQGFILVDDFGATEFLHIYGDVAHRKVALELAVHSLVDIQRTQDSRIPIYSVQRLRDEVDIFRDWCCKRLLGIESDPLEAVRSDLVDEIDSQPKTTVHRDYHCRNLLMNGSKLGIVDFQDALVGPCTYDLASLLYDCYFQHDTDDKERCIALYRRLAREVNLPRIEEKTKMVRAIEITAMQRQLKALGIFVRLWFLQQKKTHLPFVMPVLGSVVALARLNGYEGLAEWLKETISPKLEPAIEGLLA